MASQKPPVALVRRVTLIFSLAALADGAADAAADGAAADGAAVGAAADGAAVPPPLLPHAVMRIAAAPSMPNAFSRVDMCVAPSCRIFLADLPHVPCVQVVKLQTVALPPAPTIQDTSCCWLSAVAGASPILRPRRMTIARSATAIT